MKKIFLYSVLATIAFSNIYCNKEHLETMGPPSEHVITATMPPDQTYTYNLGTYGQNEPVITTQASHYLVSRVERTEGGNYIYTYIPAEHYIGTDEVVVRVLRETDGTGPLSPYYLRFQLTVQQGTQRP